MNFPTEHEIKSHARETAAHQTPWVREAFAFESFEFDLRFKSKESISVGEALVNKRQLSMVINTHHLSRFPLNGMVEYSRLNNIWETRSFKTDDWRVYIDAVVAHEMAHLVQFKFRLLYNNHPWFERATPSSFVVRDLGTFEESHGSFFTEVYSRLRRKFINHRIPDEWAMIPRSFDYEHGLTQRIEDLGEISIKGMQFEIRGTTYEVAGRNPNSSRLFKFMVKDHDGNHFRIKLSAIANASPEIKRAILSDQRLKEELTQNILDINRKGEASQKARLTRKLRA